MTLYLKQSTSIDIRMGPFVDAGDAVTPETGVTLAGADQAEVLKANGAATVAMAGTFAAVTGADGWYDYTVAAGDVDTVGEVVFVVQDADVCLPVMVRGYVLEEAIYDALFGASAAGFDANGRVDVGAVLGTAQTANDNGADINTLLTRIVGTLAAGTHNPQTGDAYARLGAPAGASVSADIADVPNTVWDEALSGHTTGGSAGKALNNAASLIVTDGTCQGTGQTSTNIRLAAGESSTDDIYKNDEIIITGGTGVGESALITAYDGTNKDCTVSPALVITCDGTSTYEILPAHSHAEDIGVTGQAQVNAEVLDVMNTDVFGEPSAGAPPASLSVISMLRYLYFSLRNKKTSDGSTLRVRNDADTADIYTKAISETGGTYTEGEGAA